MTLLKSLLRLLFRVLFRMRVEGTPVLAERLLIVANHESFLDGILLAVFLPREPVFVVHSGIIRNRLFRSVLSLVDHLEVDPTSPMALKTVIRLIESGRPVLIFPEGRITVTGSLMKVYEGPAFVAAHTGATVQPMRLDGTARSYFSRLSGRHPRRFLPRITLTILPPTHLPMPAGGTTRERRHRAAENLRRLMQKMIFDSHPRQTLYGAFLEAIGIHGRRRRLVEDVKQIEYSYGDLLKMVLAMGRLVNRHAEEGACLGVLLPNLAATLGLLIGAGAVGRVPAMLNYKAGTQGMQDACTAAGIRTVFTSRAFLQQAGLEAEAASLSGVRLLYLEDLRAGFGLGDRLWLLAHLLFPRTLERETDPERPAVVLFTSGSEGRPKGVVLSHRALLANIAQIRAIIDFSVEDKVLNALPIFHSFGLTAGALLPLLTGTNLFLYPTPLHYRAIPEIAYDRNCSVLFGTNTFLANYARFAHPYDFFRLRYVVAGAERLSEAVKGLWFEKFGLRIFEGYGATETAPVLAVNTPMAYRSGTVGQFLPAIEYQIHPVEGIPRGGMLHVRGPNLMSGYFRFESPGELQPPKSAAGEGWYETGDIVEVDEDGFVTIVGRVRRFAKVAGEMVALELVERLAALASPGGQHGAVSRADGARGEAIVLFTTDRALNREALASAARKAGMAEIAVPRSLIAVAELPLMGSGKVDYVSLQRMAGKP